MISKGLTSSSTIILGIILVRLISQDTLGTFRQVFLAERFLAGLIALQIGSSLYYFIPKLSSDKQRALVLQSTLVSLFMAGLTFLVMFFASDYVARLFSNPLIAPLIKICAFYPFASRVIELIPAYMISTDRPVRAGVFTLLASIGHMGSVVIAFAAGADLATVIWCSIIAQGLVATAGFFDMVRLSPKGSLKLDWGLVWQQMVYVYPLLITSLVGVLNLQFGKLLISTFFSPAEYAIYSCGAFELPIISLLTASLASAMMPNLVRLGQEGKTADMMHIWQEGARKCSLIIMPCFAFFLVTANDLMVFLYGASYVGAAGPFCVYLFLLPIRVVVYATVFRALGQTRYIAISAVVNLLLNMLISTAFVTFGENSLLGFVGPSIGAVVSNMIAMMYLVIKLSKITTIPFVDVMRWKELAGILLVSLCCGFAANLVGFVHITILAKIIIQLAIFTGMYFFVLFRWNLLKSDELDLIHKGKNVLLSRVLPGTK